MGIRDLNLGPIIITYIHGQSHSEQSSDKQSELLVCYLIMQVST